MKNIEEKSKPYRIKDCIQCPICKVWRNKSISKCSSIECSKKNSYLKLTSTERQKRKKEILKLRQKGLKLREIRDYFNYKSTGAVSRFLK